MVAIAPIEDDFPARERVVMEGKRGGGERRRSAEFRALRRASAHACFRKVKVHFQVIQVHYLEVVVLYRQ